MYLPEVPDSSRVWQDDAGTRRRSSDFLFASPKSPELVFTGVDGWPSIKLCENKTWAVGPNPDAMR